VRRHVLCRHLLKLVDCVSAGFYVACDGNVVPIFEARLNSSRLRAKKPLAARDLVIRIVAAMCDVTSGRQVWRAWGSFKMDDDGLDVLAWDLYMETSYTDFCLQYLVPKTIYFKYANSDLASESIIWNLYTEFVACILLCS
jgi:hypothetical protein